MKRRINIFKATKAALAAAKACSVNQARADSRAADLRPVIEDIRASGATSLRQIAARLNDRGIVTARGKEWQAAHVWKLLARLDNLAPAS
jgi:hypothetical protein